MRLSCLVYHSKNRYFEALNCHFNSPICIYKVARGFNVGSEQAMLAQKQFDMSKRKKETK